MSAFRLQRALQLLAACKLAPIYIVTAVTLVILEEDRNVANFCRHLAAHIAVFLCFMQQRFRVMSEYVSF